jgi:hypothetical protein
MEGLSRLVSESLARNGFEAAPDHNRLKWSAWFPCQDSMSALFVPSKPGLLALGEEIIAPGGHAAGGKRMLALFRVCEADDLGMALGRLLLTSERERLTSASCFARYAVIEDAAQRHSALHTFERWMAESAETASGVAMQEIGSIGARL